MRFDNNAARLHFILTSLRDDRDSSRTPTPVTGWLIKSPDFPCGSYTEALEAIQFSCELPNKIIADVNALNSAVSSTVLLSWVPNVTKAVELMAKELSGPTNTRTIDIIRDVLDTDFQSLSFCSELLKDNNSPGFVLSGRLDEFSKLVLQLKDLLENDQSMDEELRSLLLGHVNAMILATEKAEFWGISTLHRAFAETLGDIILKPTAVARSRAGQQTWEKVSQVITVMTAALSFGTATIQAVQPGQPAQIVVVNEMPSSGITQHYEAG